MSTLLNAEDRDTAAQNHEGHDLREIGRADRSAETGWAAFDEDAYDQTDFEADAYEGYSIRDLADAEDAVSVEEDGREDENDYSHAEGAPDSVLPNGRGSASEELEEFERGDPT